MNNLTQRQNCLPDTLEDLTKFVLVCQGKLKSVKVEIRAIDKLHLAKEVKDQKQNEAKMLSKSLLTAQVRVRELTREIPTAQGKRTDIEPHRMYAEKLEQKTLTETLASLGISEDQANRYETLANRPDIVEQAKAEAREMDDLPTQTAVLNHIQQLHKREQNEYYRQIKRKETPMYKKPLHGALVAHGYRQQDLCRILDRSQTYISDRMTVRKPWELDEVYAMCKLLEIPTDKIPEYFIAPEKKLRR